MRDFIFGMEDGLVSNLGLVLGVYIGGGGKFAIILAGLASMLAGAFSMSAGSYLSAKSQREVYEQEIKVVEEDVQKNPSKCLSEMKKIFQEEGVSAKESELLVKKFSKKHHPKFICNYIVQKKVGISRDKFDLPLWNALTMFFSFLVGSAFPIFPFIIFEGVQAAYIAVIATIIALFTMGSLKTYYTKRSWLKSGIEIVLVGLGAGFMGYLVGLILSHFA